MAAPSYDWLDSMIWSVGIASVLIGVIGLKYKVSRGVPDGGVQEFTAFGVILLIIGVFLFVSGLAIGIMWPFPMSGGVYNVLFSGASALGGIMLISIAYGLLRQVDFRPISYAALFFGVYLLVAAYSIASYRLTRTPEFSTLIFALLGITSILSLPAVHVRNPWILRIFGVLAIVTGLLWMFEGAMATYGHTAPPPKTTT